MKKFVGISLACLIFMNVQAETSENSNFSESSWSVQMTQKNGEPIQVQSEQKELDNHGIVIHRKSKGVIENGVYKTVSEEDLTDPTQRKTFKQNKPPMKVIHFPQDFQNNEKNKANFKRFFKFRKPRLNPNFVNPHSAESHAEMTNGSLNNKIKNRSRVSFYRPIENMVERIFGIKNSNTKELRDLDKDPNIQEQEGFPPINEKTTHMHSPEINIPPAHPQRKRHMSPKKERWLRDIYERQKALQEEINDLRAFYNDLYEDEEEI